MTTKNWKKVGKTRWRKDKDITEEIFKKFKLGFYKN